MQLKSFFFLRICAEGSQGLREARGEGSLSWLFVLSRAVIRIYTHNTNIAYNHVLVQKITRFASVPLCCIFLRPTSSNTPSQSARQERLRCRAAAAITTSIRACYRSWHTRPAPCEGAGASSLARGDVGSASFVCSICVVCVCVVLVGFWFRFGLVIFFPARTRSFFPRRRAKFLCVACLPACLACAVLLPVIIKNIYVRRRHFQPLTDDIFQYLL